MHKDVMVAAAKAAGEIISQYYGNVPGASQKMDSSVVTRADTEAEEKILSILQENHNYNVHAEESGVASNDSEFTWVIDPIDGTSNFSRGIPFYCVSIALMKGDEIHEGLVYEPVQDVMYYAEKGKGLFVNDVKIVERPTHAKQMIFFDPYHHRELSLEYFFERVSNVFSGKARSQRNMGAGALQLAYVAAGKADIFIAMGQPLYDFAAGILLVKESGCLVTDWKGNSWEPSGSLLAAPPELHAEVLSLLTSPDEA